jgi:hypothetical protein
MTDSQLLLEACEKLEDSLKCAVLGAVSSSRIETADRDIDKWTHIITQKLNDIKLLKSREKFLNAILIKGSVKVNRSIPFLSTLILYLDERVINDHVNDDVSLKQAESNLINVNATHIRWSNALKMKALSRAICHASESNDDNMKV